MRSVGAGSLPKANGKASLHVVVEGKKDAPIVPESVKSSPWKLAVTKSQERGSPCQNHWRPRAVHAWHACMCCKAAHVLERKKTSVRCEGMQWTGEPTGDDPDQESNQAGEPRLSVKAIPPLIPAQARRRENTSDAY